MKIETITKRTFQVGDLFFFTGKPVSGDAYTVGDFLLIWRVSSQGIKFTTAGTLSGACRSATGDADYINREMDAGVLEYQGNVLLGKSE